MELYNHLANQLASAATQGVVYGISMQNSNYWTAMVTALKSVRKGLFMNRGCPLQKL